MPKAQTQKEQPEEIAAIISKPAPVRKRGGKPVAIEEHTVVTKWAEERKVGAQPKQARKKAEEEIFEPEDEDDDFEGLPDELADFLRERGEQQGDIIMEVRLIDRKPGALVNPRDGLYIGSYPFNIGTYLEDLALYCAEPGKIQEFIVRLKQDGQYLPKGALKDVRVVGASVERKIAAGVLPAPVVTQPNVVATVNQATPPMQIVQPEPRSLLDQVTELASVVGTLKKAGIIQTETAAVTVQPNLPQEMTEEALLTRALMVSQDAQEKVSRGLLGKIFNTSNNQSESAPWWSEILIDLSRSIAPGINALLTTFAQAQQIKLAQAQQTIAQNGNGHSPAEQPQMQPIAQPQPLPQEPQLQTHTPEPVAQQQPTPEDLLFDKILWLCARRKMYPPQAAAKNVLAFVGDVERQSGAEVFTGAMESFLNMDAAVLVAGVAEFYPMAAPLVQQPDVPEWIVGLQTEIRKEWEQDGEQSE